MCRERVWLTVPVFVVSDAPALLVTYLPSGARFRYVPGRWPTATGMHPWYPQETWHGHGVLMLQRPGDAYGAWLFWEGADRAFDCWYLNIHEHLRDDDGTSIRDLELDVVVRDGVPRVKDDEHLESRVAEGRLTSVDITLAREIAAELVEVAAHGRQWWDTTWESWTPPPGWDHPTSPSSSG